MLLLPDLHEPLDQLSRELFLTKIRSRFDDDREDLRNDWEGEFRGQSMSFDERQGGVEARGKEELLTSQVAR